MRPSDELKKIQDGSKEEKQGGPTAWIAHLKPGTWVIMYLPVAKGISFKDISTFSSGGHVVQFNEEHFWEIILNLD